MTPKNNSHDEESIGGDDNLEDSGDCILDEQISQLAEIIVNYLLKDFNENK